jgi:hypothetical protein
MPHYYVLSPLEQPWAYLAYVVNGISSLVIILVSLYFFRRLKKYWWLLFALAFALEPLRNLIFCLGHGIPPLPYGLIYPMHQVSPHTFGQHTYVTIRWYPYAFYLSAIAMACGYLNDRRPPTAQT